MQSLPDSVGSIPAILLVDPNPDTRLLYRTVLGRFARCIDEADDGAEALGRALASPPNVVILETALPRLDGFGLCSLLRRDPGTRHVALVVVTGAALDADVARAKKAGADAVLVKPCPIDLLVETVRAVAGTRSSVSPDVPAGAGRLSATRRRSRYSTQSPPLAPPALNCPACDQLLVYNKSHLGGVSDRHPEQWDYFTCKGDCGTFQYRQRTRTLREIDADDYRGVGRSAWS